MRLMSSFRRADSGHYTVINAVLTMTASLMTKPPDPGLGCHQNDNVSGRHDDNSETPERKHRCRSAYYRTTFRLTRDDTEPKSARDCNMQWCRSIDQRP